MKLFKCLVPVLVLLLVEGSSATLCVLHRHLSIHLDTSILHRICDVESKQQDRTSASPTVNGTINYFELGATQSTGNGTTISVGTINTYSSDQEHFPTNDAREIADSRSKVNHIPHQGTVPEQSGQPGQFVPFEAPNAGGGAGPSTFGGYGPANAGSSGVGGFGGNAGNNGIISGGSSASSGSGLGGYGGTNGGSFGANAKADAVPTAGSDGSIAYRQGSSGGLSSAISNANSNVSGGSTSSSSKSTANGSGNAMAQSSSSAISTDGKSSASSYASASADTNV